MINHTYNTNSSFSVVFQYLLGILLKCGDPPGLGGPCLAGGPPLVTPGPRLAIAQAHIIGRDGGVDDPQVNMPVLWATAVMVINQRLKMVQIIRDIGRVLTPGLSWHLVQWWGRGQSLGVTVWAGPTRRGVVGDAVQSVLIRGQWLRLVTIRVCFRVHIN